jgi:hypothetical protein
MQFSASPVFFDNQLSNKIKYASCYTLIRIIMYIVTLYANYVTYNLINYLL